MAGIASDGSYRWKLIPGTYEITLYKPFVPIISKTIAEGLRGLYTTTYTVTKTETLNLEVSNLKIIDSKKLAEPAQTQQALGPFVINGKVTQLGKPMPDWLVTFRPTDGKPALAIAGVQTASDGSYNHKLNSGTYEIQLAKPTVVEIDKTKVAGWSPMFTATYIVTKAETLDLEVSNLKKIESKKSAQVIQALGPFVINDKRLLQLSGPDPCHTDAEIIASNTNAINNLTKELYHDTVLS